MITMAQSAANWRNQHTDMDHTHSLTHLQHSSEVQISNETAFRGLLWPGNTRPMSHARCPSDDALQQNYTESALEIRQSSGFRGCLLQELPVLLRVASLAIVSAPIYPSIKAKPPLLYMIFRTMKEVGKRKNKNFSSSWFCLTQYSHPTRLIAILIFTFFQDLWLKPRKETNMSSH